MNCCILLCIVGHCCYIVVKLLCIVVSGCVLFCIVVYCCLLLCIVLYCCVLFCIVVYCCYIVVYCCVLLCIVVYCCVLLCIVTQPNLQNYMRGIYPVTPYKFNKTFNFFWKT